MTEIEKTIKEVAYETLNIGSDKPKPKKQTVADLDRKIAKLFQLVADHSENYSPGLEQKVDEIHFKLKKLAWVVERIAPGDKQIRDVLKDIL